MGQSYNPTGHEHYTENVCTTAQLGTRVYHCPTGHMCVQSPNWAHVCTIAQLGTCVYNRPTGHMSVQSPNWAHECTVAQLGT